MREMDFCLVLEAFYKNDSKQAQDYFWDENELYGTIKVAAGFTIWVYKTRKSGLDFVYLHKISPMSNQAIALPIEWVAANDFEFTKFLAMPTTTPVTWKGGFFNQMYLLQSYILRPTYEIDVYRTQWRKYEYIFYP